MKNIFLFLLLFFCSPLFSQDNDTFYINYKLVKYEDTNIYGFNIKNLITNPFDRIFGVDFEIPDTCLVCICIKEQKSDTIISSLIKDYLAKGKYRIEWNFINKYGEIAESGIYILEFNAVFENAKPILKNFL